MQNIQKKASAEEWIGFDMDHTLIRYHLEPLLKMIDDGFRQILLEKLSEEKEEEKKKDGINISQIPLDLGFLRRGVFLDFETGDAILLGSRGEILVAYHGRRRRNTTEIDAVYGTDVPWKGIKKLERGCMQGYVLFSEFFLLGMLFRTLLCVELVDKVQPSFLRNYADISIFFHEFTQTFGWENVGLCKGKYFPNILRDPNRFIRHRPAVVAYLQKLRLKGKKLFLCTNSNFDYSNFLLRFLLSPFAANSEWSKKNEEEVQEFMHVPVDQQTLQWWKLFDVSFVFANKPKFFNEDTSSFHLIDFQKYNRLKSTYLKNLLKEPALGKENVELYSHRVYLGGSASVLHRVASPTTITYIGDHLMTDFRESKKIGWNSVAAIEDDEIRNNRFGVYFSSKLLQEKSYWKVWISDHDIMTQTDVLPEQNTDTTNL